MILDNKSFFELLKDFESSLLKEFEASFIVGFLAIYLQVLEHY